MVKSDADLHADIAAEREADPAQPATNAFVVIAHDGVVVLSGVVASFWQKSEADGPGASAVENELVVQ